MQLHQNSALEEAKLIYESILAQVPRHFDTLQLCATVYAQMNHLIGARATLLTAIEVATQQGIAAAQLAGVYNNLGNICRGLNLQDASLESFDTALSLKHNYAEAFCNKGLLLHDMGRLEEAMQSFDKALAGQPRYAQAFNNKGNALIAMGRFAEALLCFEEALGIKRDYAQAHSNRGLALQHLGRLQEAIDACAEAMRLDPRFYQAYNNCANAYKALGQLQMAEKYYVEALQLNPGYVDALTNLGVLYKERTDYDRALACFDRALCLAPHSAQALYNRGNLYKERRLLPQALLAFQRAVWVNPSFAEAHLNTAIVHLTQGNLLEGWRAFEWRWRAPELALSAGRLVSSIALWLGEESLDGKSILIYAEQGLGDTIQFCRYVRLVKERAKSVTLMVPTELASLLQGLSGVDALLIQGGAELAAGLEAGNFGHFDFQCPLMSLPLAFKTELDSIPNAFSQGGSYAALITDSHSYAYLQCDEDKGRIWRERLARTGPASQRVGVAWRGNPAHINDRFRSIELQEFMAALPQKCAVHVLQQSVTPNEMRVLGEMRDGHSTHLHCDYLTDMSDTAALIANLNLVVCVDTSTAHLAAALGKPVWLLLPRNADWRWLVNSSSSPWYPSARLFRQSSLGDWSDVVQEVRRALEIYFA